MSDHIISVEASSLLSAAASWTQTKLTGFQFAQ